MMRRGGGRDKFRGEYTPKFEEKGNFGRRSSPPSRHLWVGNLSPHLTEAVLADQFLRFGELESIAFLPGRSYAFVNFMRNEDAVIAMRALQNSVVDGMPMKIEYTKGERPSHGEENLQSRDIVRGFDERGESFSQRDARTNHGSPEKYFDKSKGDKSAEPCEILWIGFPTFLNIDEMILRRAFSPYGEIEKITTFPGRSYAFVQFRSVVSACRAKEDLQGKLFNNPRVNITFARSELGPSDHGRNATNTPPFSRHIKSSGPPVHNASPRISSNFDKSRDSGTAGVGRSRIDPRGNFDQMRSHVMGPEQAISEDKYEYHHSPAMDRGFSSRDFPPHRPRRPASFDEPWEFRDDPLREPKKLKTGPFPAKELPDYHFSGLRQESPHTGPRLFSERNYESGPFDYNRVTENSKNLTHLNAERDEPWKIHERFEDAPGPSPPKPNTGLRVTPETHQPSSDEVWKWEGTIAKGGTPVCRARCFPVGKVLDAMLPEFLNCTARTALDMLAKHFYQAVNYWVVFFVPESDSDIVFYNEFMHYLGERQRAAVAKLSEKTTLFLVPPSDFSEKVLKVPGKVSISGVILRFHQPSSSFGSLHYPMETMDSKFPSLPDPSYPKPSSPSASSPFWGQSHTLSSAERLPLSTSFPSLHIPGMTNLPYMEKLSEPLNESKYNQLQQQSQSLPSNHSPRQIRNSNSMIGNFPSKNPTSTSHTFDDSNEQDYFSSKSSQYTPGSSSIGVSGNMYSRYEAKSQVSSATPVLPLQAEQLAQLASLLGQRQQQEKRPILPIGHDHNESSLPNQLDPVVKSVSNPRNLQSYSSGSSAPLASQLGQIQQLQENCSELDSRSSGPRGVHQLQNTSREESEADPQKRLQATLQLAAALLQQIQQQTKTVDQQ